LLCFAQTAQQNHDAQYGECREIERAKGHFAGGEVGNQANQGGDFREYMQHPNNAEVFQKIKNGSSYFEVDVIAGNQKHEVKIDAASGQVLGSKAENDSDGDSAQLQQAGVSLRQAVSAAVAKTGGVAKEAEWENENGQSYYKVETIANGQEYDVKIDAQNGSVISAQIDKDDGQDNDGARNVNG